MRQQLPERNAGNPRNERNSRILAFTAKWETTTEDYCLSFIDNFSFFHLAMLVSQVNHSVLIGQLRHWATWSHCPSLEGHHAEAAYTHSQFSSMVRRCMAAATENGSHRLPRDGSGGKSATVFQSRPLKIPSIAILFCPRLSLLTVHPAVMVQRTRAPR